MQLLDSTKQIDSTEKPEQLEKLYKKLSNVLNGYLLDDRTHKQANEIVKQICDLDDWIRHDIIYIMLHIYEYSNKLKENNPKNDKNKIQKQLKGEFKKLNEILYWKEYDTTEIMKDVLKISKKLNIDIDLHLEHSIIWTMWDNLYRDISITSWKISNIDERLISKNSTNNIKTNFITKIFNLFTEKEGYNEEKLELKNYFWKINAPLYRIFINTITNAKQAWAKKIDVYLSCLIWSERLILKIADDWKWMNESIIKDVLFKKWESTKKESWINYWVWMHEIAKLVWSYNWEMEVYSKQWNKTIQALYTNHNLTTTNNNITSIINEFKSSWLYDTCIKSENWNEFIFKIPLNK